MTKFREHQSLGPVGVKVSGDELVLPASLRPEGYRFSTRQRRVSDKDWELGQLTNKAFEQQFSRPQPWYLNEDVVVDFPPQLSRVISTQAPDAETTTYEAGVILGVTRFRALEQERLPAPVGQVAYNAWMVELFVADYVEFGHRMNRHRKGDRRAYSQWDKEEDLHGVWLRKMMVHTKTKTEQELDKTEKQLAKREWTAPFRTYEEMLAYALIQEYLTKDVYNVMANNAADSGARFVAAGLRRIGKDEGYHFSWFETVTEIKAQRSKEDKEEMEQAVYHVARHFRMPGDAIVPNPRVTFEEYREALGITPRVFARRLHSVMTGLSYVDPNKALLVVAEYGRTVGLEKEELDDILHWPSEVLAQKFETDDKFKAIRERTERIILKPRKSKLVL